MMDRSAAGAGGAGSAAWPSRTPARAGVLPSAAAASAVTGALLLLLFLRNHRYFYVDDRIAETVPKLRDIGRILLSGQFPWLSTNILNGGAYAVEYLNGVFNPLNLILSVVVASVDDVALGSFVYVLVHALLLAGSGAWLGRALGLGAPVSVAIGVSCGFQPYTIVWNAAAWSQGLLAFAWFVFTVAALVSFHFRGRQRDGWLILAGTYGCLTSGWPLTVFVLGFLVVALACARAVERQPWRGTAWLCVWFAAGVACSLLAIVPLLLSFEVAARSSAVGNVFNFNVAPLEGLLQFSNPGYYGFFNNWEGGYALQRLPHFYSAWFILPVLVFFDWRALAAPRQALAWAFGASLLFSALLALGPERLFVFRFPNRALQYTHFFSLALAGLLIASGRFSFSVRRLGVLAAIQLFLLVNALQANPTGAVRILAFGLGTTLLGLAVWALATGRWRSMHAEASRAGADGIILAGTCAILLALAFVHRAGRGVDWGFPHDVRGLPILSAKDYTLYYGNYLPGNSGLEPYKEFRFATTGLTVGDRQLNGYSSLGNEPLRRFFALDDHGNFAPGAARGFFQVDPATGLPMVELLRVDQIIALNGEMERDLRAHLGPSWRLDGAGAWASRFRRPDYELPGLVSYAPPGLRLAEAQGCPRTHSRECVRIEASRPDASRIVFARLWFPGYHAALDGAALPVRRHADLLVAVDLPPNATGLLRITYLSPGFRSMAALALATMLAVLLGWRWTGGVPVPIREGAQAVPPPASPDRAERRVFTRT